MPTPLIVIVVAFCVIDVACLIALWGLRRRGVRVYPKTKFGPAMVFDSVDDDGVAIRLLNVGGKFQSVSYVDEALRWRLACMYHQYFAQVVEIQAELWEESGASTLGTASAEAAGPDAARRDDAEQGESGRDGGAPCKAESSGAGATSANGIRRRALVIGGGGYSFPKWLVSEAPDVATTVVEIDPAVTKIAREHFFLDDLEREFQAGESGRLRLVCDDGWAYLSASDEQFDIIVNDAFGGHRPLGPLKTDAGAAAVRAHLTPRGIYLANVISPLEGKGSAVLRESTDACKSAFEHVYLIPESPEDARVTGDNVLVASNASLAIAAEYVVK
ncbi:MAG: fused MFS/spermidine synthase [Olsenella sp.]|nr:fused MFS/spermidine synthase [Olsenella sp.]